MKKLLEKLNSLFLIINVNIFCDEERLVIEIDKYELFYFNHLTGKFKYKHMDIQKAEYIRNQYMYWIVRGDYDG